MLARLALIEFKRTTSRLRYWLLIAVNASFALFAVWQVRQTTYPGTAMTAPIAFALGYVAISLMPVMAPLVMGDSLASDRRSGYLALQLSRDVNRWVIAAARSLAAVGAGILAALLCALPCAGLAIVSFPPSGGTPEAAVAFLPGLLAWSPIAYAVTLACLYGLAAGAVASCSLAVGTFVARPVAAALVAVFLLGIGLLIPVQSLNPLERIMFANTWNVAWTLPGPMLGYWGTVLLVATTVATIRLRVMDHS